MSQEQRRVPLLVKGLPANEAAATGNNASWICPCHKELPLIGRSGLAEKITEGLIVVCPDCKRRFFVMPDGSDYGSAIRVEEV